jgi:hypothetical protein
MATDVSTSLPDVELAPGTTITVNTLDASAKVTLLNVYGISPVTHEPVEIQLLPPLLVHEPQAGTEAPGLTP